MLRIKPDNINLLARRGELELSRYEDIKTGGSFLLMSGKDKDAFLGPRAVLASEFKISNECNVPGVLKGKKLYEMIDGPALMLENFEGMPLAYFIKYLSENPKLLFTAVMSILDTVHDIHRADIVHRSLDSKSILLARPKDELQQHSAITFMGLSCMNIGEGAFHGLNIKDYHHFLSPEYMSPEVTGLADTEVDHRADLYSLGIVFYEILTGSPPFRSRNRREIMNWHVSRKAVPPREINGTVPPVLSDMVMVLLEKDPSGRYESAEALAEDIKKCAKNLREDGSIKTFSVYPAKVLPDIGVSEKIVGRNTEKELLATDLYTAGEGGSAATFLCGQAGTGKTVLAKGIEKEVYEHDGWFAWGKFDQKSRDIPYGVFSDAISSLVKQILMCPDRELENWKKVINAALFPHAPLLQGLSPDLGYIIDDKETMVQGDPQARAVLVMETFKKFLATVASNRRPLVLFLDDLQWADEASLKLLSFLLDGEPVDGLLIIGAYRDNEVDERHPLQNILHRIGCTLFPSQLIQLAPLGPEHVKEVICSFIGEKVIYSNRLTDLIVKKTGGNPLYVRKFIHLLNDRGLLYHDGGGTWKWEHEKIDSLPVTENVVDLLVDIIDKLSADEKLVLKAASCMKDCFAMEIMLLVTGLSEKRINSIMRQLIKKDLLVLDEDFRYSFSHDRIKEASSSSVDDREVKELHYKIGNAMLSLYGREKLYDNIFEIADHLDLSRDLITADKEWDYLIDITLKAAVFARGIAAYSASVSYYQHVLDYLPAAGKDHDLQLLYRVYKEYAESLLLDAQYDASGQAVDRAMAFSSSLYEKADLYSLLIDAKTLEMKTQEAIEAGLQALKMLGMELPEDIHKLAKPVEDAMQKVRKLLYELSLQDLVDLPLCRDERVIHILKIMDPLAAACFQMGWIELNMLIVLNIILLSCENGITPESVTGFVAYGYRAAPLWEEYDLAKKLAEASLELCKKHDYQHQLCVVGVHKSSFIDYWHGHLKYSDALLDLAQETAQKTGNIIFLHFALVHKMNNRFYLGRNIELCLQKTEDELRIIARFAHEQTMADLKAGIMIYGNLNGRTKDPKIFELEDITEEAILYDCRNKKFYTSILIYHINKCLVLYVYGDYEAAYNEIMLLDDFPDNLTLSCHYFFVQETFLKSMSICSLYSGYSGREAEEKLALVKGAQEKMRKWAYQTPDNVLFKYLLVDAEIARIKNRVSLAMTLYDQAILAAYKSEYQQFEAIACERAAGFWFDQGKHEFAYIYLDRAYVCYREWGAVRKIELMQQVYPERYTKKIVGGTFNDHEILSLLSSFNALSGQMNTADLVNELADIVLLHSGAESFLFLAEQKSRNRIMVRKKSGATEKSEMELLPLEKEYTREDIAFPVRLMRYMKRTGKDLYYYDANSGLISQEMNYMGQKAPRSALCLQTPTARGDVLWYLDNSLVEGAFKDVNVKVLEMIAQQALLCIENILYHSGGQTYQGPGGLSFRYNNEIRVIPCENIIYCSSHGRHSVVHAAEGTFKVSMLLKDIEEKLPDDIFLRVHKQYIVNTSYIASLKRKKSGNHIIVLSDEDDTHLLIGRVYYDRLCERLNI